MRKILLFTTCLTLPGLALADDFPLPAPVTAAEIYLQGAALTRTGSVELPMGAHRLLVPWTAGEGLPDITLTGAVAGAVEILPDAAADPRAYLSEPQLAALETLRGAEEILAQTSDARIRAAADLQAAEARLAFLRSLTGGDIAANDPSELMATADVVASGVRAAEIARADAQAAVRAADRAVEAAETVLEQARIDLNASGATLDRTSLMAIAVTVEEAGSVDLTIETFAPQAGWSPRYDVTLGADDTVTLDRMAEIRQATDLPLRDVVISLSTADPFAQVDPSPVFANEARLRPDAVPLQSRSASSEALQGFAMDTRLDTSQPPIATANLDGPVVTYDYPTPVTVPQNGSVTLTLGTQVLDARVFNRANPRQDPTAYLMAEVTNSTGEPLLSGPATLYREDARIGETVLPLMPAGDEVELAFGPQQHLRLEYVRLDNEAGDQGLFFTSGLRRQEMAFRVRNLSDQPETVETLFALPYSELEDLEITVTAAPGPDARDVGDRRGVAQWDLDVAGGAQVEVEIGVALEWPEGETLLWQP